MTAASLGSLTLYTYMKDVESLLRIEGGVKAAITTIMLSIMKNILLLIVNNGFPINKLINKHEITQIQLGQYMLHLGLKC
jgi:hypothetical protein